MDEQRKTKILQVEDQGIIALSTQANLNRLGYDVAVVINGESAIRQIRSNFDYDLTLMDIDLGEG